MTGLAKGSGTESPEVRKLRQAVGLLELRIKDTNLRLEAERQRLAEALCPYRVGDIVMVGASPGSTADTRHLAVTKVFAANAASGGWMIRVTDEHANAFFFRPHDPLILIHRTEVAAPLEVSEAEFKAALGAAVEARRASLPILATARDIERFYRGELTGEADEMLADHIRELATLYPGDFQEIQEIVDPTQVVVVELIELDDPTWARICARLGIINDRTEEVADGPAGQ